MVAGAENSAPAAAEAEELEAVERERARRRQIELAGKRNSDLEEMLPQGDGTTRRAPQTRDKVAAAVGLGSGDVSEIGHLNPSNPTETFPEGLKAKPATK